MSFSGLNRQQRRQLMREKTKVINAEEKIGLKGVNSYGDAARCGGTIGNGEEIVIRDWANSDDDRAFKQHGIALEKSIIDHGVENIKVNLPKIKAGKGIKDLPKFKNDTAFLVGAGGSFAKYTDKIHLFQDIGTTITTNRGLKAYAGAESFIDYAFMIDSKLYLISQEPWWPTVDTKKIDAIFSFNVHPSVTDFKDCYWFEHGAGYTPAWRTEAEKGGINCDDYGYLDSGFCGLFPMFHLCHVMNVKRIVMVGHDFSFVDNLKYFDRYFSLRDERERIISSASEFKISIREDVNGNLVCTQRYLENQCKALICAIKNMADNGVEIYNIANGGILYDDCIKQVKLNELC